MAGGGAIPVAIHLDRFGVNSPVIGVGVDPVTGEMAVPPTTEQVAWYRDGPSAGRSGSAVLAGHVDYNGRRGAFFHLADLHPGDSVGVDLSDGARLRFTVTATAQYAKAQLPVDDLFRHDGAPRLTLITCGGEFRPAQRSYADNVVVYASPT